ncbi:MAG: hypothetical protein ABH952_07500 [Candidatus Omnitrophota bacterium]
MSNDERKKRENDEIRMMNEKKNYDLKERTAKFGEAIIEFAKKIPQNPITISLITQ